MRLSTKLLVIGLLYLAEGIPFGFINSTLAVYFRMHGMDLASIGLIGIVGLPWSLKFLWAPLMDKWGLRWHWIAPAQMVIAVIIALTAVVPLAGGVIWAVMLLLCFAAATQDAAIDAYTIDILEEEELGIANGVRIGTYRIAMVIGGGGLTALSQFMGWKAAFCGLAGLMVISAFTVMVLPQFHQSRIKATPHPDPLPLGERGLHWWYATWVEPVKSLFQLKNVAFILIFVMIFKLGDAMMGSMIAPFWIDRGFTRVEYGMISSTGGMAATIVGALFGGWFTTRFGIWRALWILGAFQAISNLGYAGAALDGMPRLTVYGASVFESLTGGMGGAAFMAYLMSLCSKEYSASQYSIMSALFGLGRSVAGFVGGIGAKYLGYAPFFALTFLAALPAFGLIPFIVKKARCKIS